MLLSPYQCKELIVWLSGGMLVSNLIHPSPDKLVAIE